MNTAHMTPEDWHQYFQTHPSPAVEYMENLKEALKGGFIQPMLAQVRLMEISAKMHEVSPVVDKIDQIDQRRIADSFLPHKGITIPASETNNVDRT